MRILFVLENYYPHIGGVEIVFKNLCEKLVKKGHQVDIITHKLPNSKDHEILNGVNIFRVACFDSRYIFTFAAIPKAIKLAKSADIIHTTTYNGAFPAWFASIIRKKPKIITVHETWLGKWQEYSNLSWLGVQVHEFLEWLLYIISRFDKYVCVSNSTKAMLTEVFPKRKEKIIAIHNGFDDNEIKELNKKSKNLSEAKVLARTLKGKFVIFSWGRPGASKGFEYLIDSVPLIKKDIPNAVLVLMLSKDKQYVHKIDEFKKTLEQSNSSDAVVFVNPQPYKNIGAYRNIAKCIVVPSISEGFGYVVLEAVTSNVPVVATNTTSIPEVIYGKHILVDARSAKAIAKGILQVKKGKFTTTKKKSFPWSETVNNYEAVYKELTKK